MIDCDEEMCLVYTVLIYTSSLQIAVIMMI